MSSPRSVDQDSLRWAVACLIYAQPQYHRCGLPLRLLGSMATPGGIAISSALPGCQVSDFLAAQYADRYFQFIPGADQGLPAWRCGASFPNAGFDGIPASLADRDRVVCSAPHPLAGTPAVQGRLHRLDSLYGGSKRPIDCLHIAEPVSRAIEILSGGQALLLHDQPALLFEWPGAEDITALARHLYGLGYLLLDSSLLLVVEPSVTAVHPAVKTETCFVGLPRAFVEHNGLAGSLWPGDTRLGTETGWQNALIAGFTREARNGGVRFFPSPPTRYHYAFNDQLLCENFYPTERRDGLEWRWLGPMPSARVWLGRPNAGRYRLELSVLGAQAEDLIDGTRLFLAGRLLDVTREKSDGVTKLAAAIEIPCEQEDPLVELVIAVPATLHASPEDRRQIGICVSALDLTLSPVAMAE